MVSRSYNKKNNAVAEPALRYVKCVRSGEDKDAVEYLNRFRYKRLTVFRNLVKDKFHKSKSPYQCSICKTPLYLINSTRNKTSFRHPPNGKKCPISIRGLQSHAEIRKRIYANRCESPLHKSLKEKIQKSICADSSFSEPLIETRRTGVINPTKWRKPDIQATYASQAFAFEA
ncbi:MAG: hypothetical protein JKX72_01630 [Robiginitomaculum sp.]|nr:hypothetical protein [Robiginitomaculum sp.]